MKKRFLLPPPASVQAPLRPGLRMLRWLAPVVVLVTALLATFLQRPAEPRAHPPAVQSASAAARMDADCEGTIHSWLLAVPDRFADAFVDTQAALIAGADKDIRFHVVYSAEAGRLALTQRVRTLRPKAAERITFHHSQESVSPWVRDYYLPARLPDGSPLALLHHAEHYRGAYGPWESSDPSVFVHALPGLGTRETRNRLDGGAVVADGERIFAGDSALSMTLRRGETRDAHTFLQGLETDWGRPVTLLGAKEASASGHCDLFLMPAGERRLVLGSPYLGTTLLAKVPAAELATFVEKLREHTREQAPEVLQSDPQKFAARLRAETNGGRRIAAIETIGTQLARLGYATTRVPFLALNPQTTGLYMAVTYTNVIMDVRAGKRTVYMPVYGLTPLDLAGRKAWESLGYRVVPIDVVGAAVNGGAIRCLSQVTRE